MIESKKKPNVILMFVDDLGYGDISYFNDNSKIQTKHIDSLAKGGMCFSDSHSTSAVCTPSRYGLLTGRYNWRSRLKFLVLPGDSHTLIEKDRMTLGHLFKKAGYMTSCVGKWHLGLEWAINNNPRPKDFGLDKSYYEGYKPRTTLEPTIDFSNMPPVPGLDIDYDQPIKFGPIQYGFDSFFGLPASLDQPPYVYIRNDRVVEKPTSISGVLKLDRGTGSMQDKWQMGPIAPSYDHTMVLDDMNNEVLDLIDKSADKDEPFFIYYPTPAVHGPLLPKDEFVGKSGLNPYGDIVLQLDDMVGKIMDKLKEKNIFEETIVIFTSDNGCSGVADYPFLLEHGHNPSYQFRGKKFELFEGGHRVPTIVHFPDLIKAGWSEHNICHTDFFATFAELLNIPLEDHVAEDSFSNLDLWNGKETCKREGTIYSSGTGFFSIVKNGWKLICSENGGHSQECSRSAFTYTRVNQDFELYNLNKDIGEENNLVDQYPDLVKELIEMLDKGVSKGRTTLGIPQENFQPEKEWVQINWR